MVFLYRKIRKKIKNITGKEWLTLTALAVTHIATPLLLGRLPPLPIASAFEEEGQINVLGVASNTVQTAIAVVLFHTLDSAMSTTETIDAKIESEDLINDEKDPNGLEEAE